MFVMVNVEDLVAQPNDLISTTLLSMWFMGWALYFSFLFFANRMLILPYRKNIIDFSLL